jgi:hypothetical protein
LGPQGDRQGIEVLKLILTTGNLKLAGDSGGLRATRGQTMLTMQIDPSFSPGNTQKIRNQCLLGPQGDRQGIEVLKFESSKVDTYNWKLETCWGLGRTSRYKGTDNAYCFLDRMNRISRIRGPQGDRHAIQCKPSGKSKKAKLS